MIKTWSTTFQYVSKWHSNRNIKRSSTIFHANDTVVFNKGSVENVGIKHNTTLEAAANWFYKNNLTINTSKTKHIVFLSKSQCEPMQTNIWLSRNGTNKRFQVPRIKNKQPFEVQRSNKFCQKEPFKFQLSLLPIMSFLMRTQLLLSVCNVSVKPIVQYANLIYGSTKDAF